MEVKGSIYNDIESYDLTQSSSSSDEEETPEPKRKADDKVVTSNYSQDLQPSASYGVTPSKPPSKRQEPTEGYIYGFILPFNVDNAEYYVVKIGKTTSGQLVRRLRDHNKQFSNATGVPIFDELTLSATSDERTFIDTSLKWKDKSKVFLVSYIKDGLRAAENEANLCIGVARFNTSPTFREVFSSRKVTTTEWFVARKQVVEAIQVDFWHNRLDTFDMADDFMEKLKELNRRKHTELNISLDTIATRIYHSKVKVPEYVRNT